MIEGIPDGWELVRVGPVKYGEWRLMDNGKVMQWTTALPSIGWAVVLRKIEKPKQYRPFANAAEFKPFRDRWIQRSAKHDTKDTLPAGCFKVVSYNDHHVWTVDGKTISYEQMFAEGKTFDDGSPFAVEVQ